MLKVFRDSIEDLEEVVPISKEVFYMLCEELDDALCDRDYAKIDALDIEYITRA